MVNLCTLQCFDGTWERAVSGETVYPERGHFAGKDWAFHQICILIGPWPRLHPRTPECVFTETAIAGLKCEGIHSLPKLKTSIQLNEHFMLKKPGVREKKSEGGN